MLEKQTMARRSSAVFSLVIYALFAAILAVMSQLSIPMPSGVPITLQTFGVCLCGYFLGVKAVIPTFVYIALGLVGLPVFSNFGSGYARLIGPTGGFIFGFIFLALLCGTGITLSNKIGKHTNKNVAIKILSDYILPLTFGILGMAICYMVGIIRYSFDSEASLPVLLISFQGLFIKDVALMVIALLLSKTIKLRLSKFVSF